jgi:pimeloyl-ACP methyl ester carboxylesterase
MPLNQPFTDSDVSKLTRFAALECVAFWTDQGIDVAGYNTLENARDIDDLREHLGANSVTLWGISYGSHLALASLKVMENRVHKIVIASAEGLDQTVKLPSRTDAYFQRLQTAINTQADAAALYPDVSALIRRVNKQLEQAPILLQVPGENGESEQFLFQRFHMQAIASGMIADPQRGVASLLALYRGIDEAVSQEATRQALIAIVKRAGLTDNRIRFWPMPLAMDVASGISSGRMQQVEREAESSLLGLRLNFPMPQLANQIPSLDLGDQFRAAPRSAVPTLLLSGTLDGRTYIDAQKEATQGLSKLTQITVINAGHNLFMMSPRVTEAIHSFLRDEEIGYREIVIPLPRFAQ